MRKPKEQKERAPRKPKVLDTAQQARLDLANDVMKGDLIHTKIGVKWKLLDIYEDNSERWDSESRGNIVARLVNWRKLRVPGRGKDKAEAVINALKHLEVMGYNIIYSKDEIQECVKETVTSAVPVKEAIKTDKKKKKGIPFA